jgi:hypothetical protein
LIGVAGQPGATVTTLRVTVPESFALNDSTASPQFRQNSPLSNFRFWRLIQPRRMK